MGPFLGGAGSKFNVAFPLYGDTQVTNSVQYTESGATLIGGKSNNSVEVDKGTSGRASSVDRTEYSHGAKTGTTHEDSYTYGGGFVVVPEIIITIRK